MKIITYNVNGLRAAVSKGLPEWLVQENPDVLCLQETKLQPDQYPAEVFEALGYKSYLYSAQKKGYSGLSALCRHQKKGSVNHRSFDIQSKDNHFHSSPSCRQHL